MDLANTHKDYGSFFYSLVYFMMGVRLRFSPYLSHATSSKLNLPELVFMFCSPSFCCHHDTTLVFLKKPLPKNNFFCFSKREFVPSKDMFYRVENAVGNKQKMLMFPLKSKGKRRNHFL